MLWTCAARNGQEMGGLQGPVPSCPAVDSFKLQKRWRLLLVLGQLIKPKLTFGKCICAADGCHNLHFLPAF